MPGPIRLVIVPTVAKHHGRAVRICTSIHASSEKDATRQCQDGDDYQDRAQGFVHGKSPIVCDSHRCVLFYNASIGFSIEEGVKRV